MITWLLIKLIGQLIHRPDHEGSKLETVKITGGQRTMSGQDLASQH